MTKIPRHQCPHLNEDLSPTLISDVCEECGARGPIRMCLTCGHIGCCESLQGHATAHAKETGHALIRSLPFSANSFVWCYKCQAYLS
jgi:uncharacterized UBP type Zn finger protein